MVKRYILQFAAMLTVSILVLLVIAENYWQSQAQRLLSSQGSSHAQIISEINLLVSSHTQSEQNNPLNQKLQHLNDNPGVLFWQLRNDNGRLLDQKAGEFERFVIGHQYSKYYIYIPVEANKLSTLELFLPSEAETQILGIGWILILTIMLVSGITGACLLLLKGVSELEETSIELLGQQDHFPELTEKIKHTPIARVLSQMHKIIQELKREKRQLSEEIRKTTYVDEATELGNKAFFKAEFQVRLINHDAPETGLLVLFSFVERDHEDQKILDKNRAMGIANILRRVATQYSDALVARLNETDFVLLTPNQVESDVDNLCRKIIHQLEKMIFDNTPIVEHFVDIGISVYKRGFDYYKVMAEADMALRNAQFQGGNSWFMYGETLPLSKVRGHLKWNSFLKQVLDRRQIHLYGQTIIYFDGSDISHQEVFARVEDGDTLLTADTFLPMASRCGLASEFDRQVVNSLIKHCLHSNESMINKKFSINLFISSLLDERFISWLIGKLSSLPQLCRHFIFEVRESQISEHVSAIKPVMEQLVPLGVSWCVERFGAPDQSLDYLSSLPISMVKLDRRIVNNIAEDDKQQLLLKTLILELSSKSISIFAEGVEEENDAEYLKLVGIQGAQGFYYEKPRRLDRLERLLKAI